MSLALCSLRCVHGHNHNRNGLASDGRPLFLLQLRDVCPLPVVGRNTTTRPRQVERTTYLQVASVPIGRQHLGLLLQFLLSWSYCSVYHFSGGIFSPPLHGFATPPPWGPERPAHMARVIARCDSEDSYRGHYHARTGRHSSRHR